MISFPKTLEEIDIGEIRAGGTDFQERRHLGLSHGKIIDIRDLKSLEFLENQEDGFLIGTKVTIATLSQHPEILRLYPGLAFASGGLATPQIRAVATLGGNLLQRVRCWYFRNADNQDCFKKGASFCAARTGDHLYHSCFDLGPCIAPHPSTLGMALLAYNATAILSDGTEQSIKELYGDGKDPTTEHRLPENAFLHAIRLPKAVSQERAAYFRVISRALAEWPLVEVLARLVLQGETIQSAYIAIGGVAPIPMRLEKVEKQLIGEIAASHTFEKAATLAVEGASPLPMTAYKITLIPSAVQEALERAFAMKHTGV